MGLIIFFFCVCSVLSKENLKTAEERGKAEDFDEPSFNTVSEDDRREEKSAEIDSEEEFDLIDPNFIEKRV